MLNISRVYVAASDAVGIAAIVEQDAMFNICGLMNENTRVEDDLIDIGPDFLILDGALLGHDGLDLLAWIRRNMPAPPRVLYLSRGEERWGWKALDIGADAVISWPDDAEKLLAISRKVATMPCPRLSSGWQNIRMKLAEGLLNRLQVPVSLKGRAYMQAAIADGACSPWLIQSFSNRLYPWLAQRFSSTPQAVERAIRTAVENTWLKGDLNAIQQLFGFSVDADRGKPTNAEFLSMLAAHAHRELKRMMREKNRDKQQMNESLKNDYFAMATNDE